MRRWLYLFVILAVLLTGCATSGTAYRQGYTEVPATTMISVEQYINPGINAVGNGWHLIWVAGDEFYYCVGVEHADWIDRITEARESGRTFRIDYINGGPEGQTGACSSGIPETYAVRVTGITVLQATGSEGP